MSLLKRLTGLLAPRARQRHGVFYPLAVECARCGERLDGSINLHTELSIEYGEAEAPTTTYVCRKVLMGQGRCFQQVEVRLTFDAQRRVISREISGGKYIDDAPEAAATTTTSLPVPPR